MYIAMCTIAITVALFHIVVITSKFLQSIVTNKVAIVVIFAIFVASVAMIVIVVVYASVIVHIHHFQSFHLQ